MKVFLAQFTVDRDPGDVVIGNEVFSNADAALDYCNNIGAAASMLGMTGKVRQTYSEREVRDAADASAFPVPAPDGDWLRQMGQAFLRTFNPEAKPTSCPADKLKAFERFPPTFAALAAEMVRARSKFPSNKHLIVALGEEYGEVCNAALEGLTREEFRAECIQVACVALRLAEEGDPEFPVTLPEAEVKA